MQRKSYYPEGNTNFVLYTYELLRGDYVLGVHYVKDVLILILRIPLSCIVYVEYNKELNRNQVIAI